MTSQLQSLAKAIRQVGAQGGPVREPIHGALGSARRLSGQVPQRVPSSPRVAASLERAQRALSQAEAALAEFSQRGDAFAARLVWDGSGASGGGGARRHPPGDGARNQITAEALADFFTRTRAGLPAVAAALGHVGKGIAITGAVAFSVLARPAATILPTTQLDHDVGGNASALAGNVAEAIDELGESAATDGDDSDPAAWPQSASAPPPPGAQTPPWSTRDAVEELLNKRGLTTQGPS